MYDFEDLREALRKIGINPEQGSSTFKLPPTIRREMTREQFKSEVDFEFDEEEGVFLKMDGKTYKGFLYIPIFNQQYALQRGWNTMPKFHIKKCQTIENQIYRQNFNGHYVFANTPITDMVDVDGLCKDLEICGYCCSSDFPKDYTTTQHYNKIILNAEESPNFELSDLPKEFETDIWGYTPEWYEISKAYRFKMNFTCEACGLKLDGSNGYYLDTHHKNGNKTDNRDSNLQCLCVLCHSNVDPHHQRNFSTGRNLKRIQDFRSLFDLPDKSIQMDNHLYGKAI